MIPLGCRHCGAYAEPVLGPGTGPRGGGLRAVGPVTRSSNGGSVSKVEMVTPMGLIYKALFPSISTFETPPLTESQPQGAL